MNKDAAGNKNLDPNSACFTRFSYTNTESECGCPSYYFMFDDEQGMMCPTNSRHAVVTALDSNRVRPKEKPAKRDFDELPARYDILEGKPARVKVWSKTYWCQDCCKHFLHTTRPYTGKKRTTDGFEEYLVNRILHECSITDLILSKEFPEIGRTTMYDIFRSFLKRKHLIDFQKMDCDELWFVPITANGKSHVITYGSPSPAQRRVIGYDLKGCKYLILNYTKGSSVIAALRECEKYVKDVRKATIFIPQSVILSLDEEDRYRTQMMQEHYTATEIAKRINKRIFDRKQAFMKTNNIDKLELFLDINLPPEIDSTTKIAQRMRNRGLSFEALKIRLLLLNDFKIFPIDARLANKSLLALDYCKLDALPDYSHEYMGLKTYKMIRTPTVSLFRNDFSKTRTPLTFSLYGAICESGITPCGAACYHYGNIADFLAKYEDPQLDAYTYESGDE